MNSIRQIGRIAWRECGIWMRHPIYLFCMVLFPILVVFFFTSMLAEGTPTELPCGIVDSDNTPTTRALIRKLDGFQSTHIVARYPQVSDARKAIQRGEIYAFMYIPKGTTSNMLASRQPTVSFYYSNVTLLAGGMLYRDLKTIGTLGSAAIGSAKLSATGKSEGEIRAFLQPIAIDLHMIGNPWSNYNVYLSTMMIPGILILFIFLITVYSIGTELKFNRSKQWIQAAGGNIAVALTGKLLPHFIIFTTIMLGYLFYQFYILGFPHPGGLLKILMLGVLTVLAAEGFGVFVFGLMPSLRLSMSVCSLWAVLGFSISGATYPVFAMNPMIEGLSWLFPLRHYYMVYQIGIFNGYPIYDAWLNVTSLVAFALLPLLTAKRIKKAMLEYVYIP